ncbi:MAG: GNAT family N-acetyltransferase [Bdellovibrionota bacterium]
MKLTLVSPSVDYKDSFLEAIRAFKSEGLWWYDGVDPDLLNRDFETYVNEILERTGETSFWAIVNDQFAGRISLRHELTPALRILGGHIGYDVSPLFRNQGVASEMLRKILPLAKTIGLIEVLLTTDDTNISSIKVIERNGGVLKETKKIAEGKPLKRYYWIPLN